MVFAACAMAMALPAPAVSQIIKIEAENYADSYDIAFELIRLVPFDGGAFLFGLDYPGEWTEYPLTVETFGEYGIRMMCRGEMGETCQFRLFITEAVSGHTQTCDVYFTGAGFG
jgi:hypothetical protein